MRVNEVKLSTGGDATKQWVELIDSLDEPGVDPPYKLRVFNAGGGLADEQNLPGIFDGEDTQPYLVASGSSGLTGDAMLSVLLPLGAGHVCFTRASNAAIHCISYGCPAAQVGSLGGTQRGLAPSDAESLGRSGASLFLGSPTPDLVPNSATTPAACPTSGGGGGGGGTGGGGTGGGGGLTVDSTAPAQTLSYRRTQDIDRLAVAVRLSEASVLAVSGTINVPGRARLFRFRTFRRTVAAGVRTNARLRLSRAGLRAAKRYIRRTRRRLTARVTISGRDASGNSSTRRLSIRVRN
jgi:hypothetical protein